MIIPEILFFLITEYVRKNKQGQKLLRLLQSSDRMHCDCRHWYRMGYSETYFIALVLKNPSGTCKWECPSNRNLWYRLFLFRNHCPFDWIRIKYAKIVKISSVLYIILVVVKMIVPLVLTALVMNVLKLVASGHPGMTIWIVVMILYLPYIALHIYGAIVILSFYDEIKQNYDCLEQMEFTKSNEVEWREIKW